MQFWPVQYGEVRIEVGWPEAERPRLQGKWSRLRKVCWSGSHPGPFVQDMLTIWAGLNPCSAFLSFEFFLAWILSFFFFFLSQCQHQFRAMSESYSESCSAVSHCLQSHGLYRNSPGQNTGVGSLSLLQGIFPIQGLNPGLPHCRWFLYQLSHKGSPRILEWVVYLFSSRSSKLEFPSCDRYNSPKRCPQSNLCVCYFTW